MAAAAACARKTFRYPSDEDADERDAIDEQEQDQLITSLRARDAAHSTFYINAFTLLTLLSTLPHLSRLLSPSPPPHTSRLPPLIATTSHLCSANTLYFLRPSPSHTHSHSGAPTRQPSAGEVQGQGPIRRYLIYLNALLCVLLWWPAWRAGGWEAGYGIAPTVTFAVVLVVRGILAPVDVEGLERLRYGYKGA